MGAALTLTAPQTETLSPPGTASQGGSGSQKLQEVLEKSLHRKKKKKLLDDLSTLGIGCCHLAGNYLPIRAGDGPAKKKKKGVAVKDQAQSSGRREKKKSIRKRARVRYSEKS